MRGCRRCRQARKVLRDRRGQHFDGEYFSVTEAARHLRDCPRANDEDWEKANKVLQSRGLDW